MDDTMPQGRIVLKRICQSRKLAALKTDGARLLYSWLIPNVDVNGCFSGEPEVIKGQIFTRLKKSCGTVQKYLDDLAEVSLILLYEVNGDIFLQIPDFVDKQPHINPDREAKSTIPLPTPDQLKTYSGVTPPKREGESKSKIESKEKEKAKHLDFVFLSKTEYKKLVQRYGEQPTRKLINSLNTYIGQTGKKYKSHYFTLLKFAVSDSVEELPTPETEKEQSARESAGLEKRQQEIRDEDGKYFREMTDEQLKAILADSKDQRRITRAWLIKEILVERR